MSRIYAAYSVGALVGLGLAALGGVGLPFATYAAVVLLCLPLVVALPIPTASNVTRDLTMIRTRGIWTAAIAIMFAITAIGTLDGVLPLHFATRLTQSQIGLAYIATAVLVAVASAAAGNTRLGVAMTLGGVGIVGGIALAGASTTVPLWLTVHYLTAQPTPGTLHDPHGQALHHLGVTADDIGQYLVRPDGHVGYRAGGNDLTGLARYVSHWLLA